ncbi:hypothetical protein [Alteraurantiacibacter aquimixticola]|uniref:Uncharacterized protein n=1 Tax=Alteraurantiacibacter aquimixticola TaxID=2489173 RepID=A0A4T3F3Q9_9SPHN|nr:hypothetical protein [Alteraurantiacibacter aquimixticola]TIX50148.1 hypothetical protein E5222_07590 [Alteraurantiacibacter aquimixticola]
MIAKPAFFLLAIAVATPTAAQDIAPVAVDLMEGVAFVGEGGVELEEAADGTPVAAFWRPLSYRQNDQLLAGRMECRAAARREPYRAALYQLEQVHAAQVAQGRLEGLTELETRSQPGEIVSRYDVLGRRTSPRRYQVLTYIAVRTAAELVSIRQTCSFLRDGNIYRQDFFPFVDRHTSFVLALPPPDSADPYTAPTLDSITDIAS